MTPVNVEPRLFPPLSWFVEVPPHSLAVINVNSRWNKRVKTTHRYTVADVNGPVELTVPVEKPASYSDCTLGDIRLSKHGQWWHVHKVTLESGYGRTPFFEHYFPYFERFYTSETVDRYPFLWQYLQQTTNVVFQLLDTNSAVGIGVDAGQSVVNGQSNLSFLQSLPSYWQIRKDRLGFLPGLSILDILFNLGPEAILYLRRLKP